MAAPDKKISFLPWTLLTSLIVFCAIIMFLMPPLGLAVNDSGVKYAQMLNFVNKGIKGIEMEYPGRIVDKDLRFMPGKEHKMIVFRNGKIYCDYDVAFPYISSKIYKILGSRVIYFMPLLSFIISIVFMYKILKMFVAKESLIYVLLFLYGFASPITNQALLFMEHLPALALITIGFYFLVQNITRTPSVVNLSMGSCILGAAIFFRSEVLLLYLTAEILLIAHFISIQKHKYAFYTLIVMLMPLSLFAIINYAICGNVFGLHILIEPMVGAKYMPSASKIIVAVVTILAMLYAAKNSGKTIYNFILLIFIGFTIAFVSEPYKITFIASAPLCLLAFYRFEDNDGNTSGFLKIENILQMIVFGYILLFVLIYNNYSMPQERFFLPIMPLIFILLGIKMKYILENRTLLTFFILLGVSSLYSAFNSTKDTIYYCNNNQERVDFLEKNTQPGSVIVFQFSPLSEHSGALYFDRLFFDAFDLKELKDLEPMLKNCGIKEYYFMTSNGLPIGKENLNIVQTGHFRGLVLYKISQPFYKSPGNV